MKKNAIEKSDFINKKYKEYIRSSFRFNVERVQKEFEKQLDKELLFKGPYVDLSLPFERGKTIKELVDEGVLCNSFLQLEDININRPLYKHQEESINIIGSGRSAVITTGTGSGKTECFLFPILNDLLKDAEGGNQEKGIRALFLYPMNALVNDQIDRVRRMLVNCPQITYGFFTGDTPEKEKKGYREELSNEIGFDIPEHELVTREEIRENPPQLLFTNYSMLEYLMIRPNDYSIFTPERLKNWKYVVMDEAHTYYGSLGIEVSLLMRRVTGLAERKPRFILTSATLGEKGESEADILEFASNLTSAEFTARDIVFSSRIPMKPELIQYKVDGKDYINIKKSLNDISAIKGIFKKYNNSIDSDDVKKCLYDLLIRDRNVFDLFNILKKNSKRFDYIIENYDSDITKEQLICLIDLINYSEKNGIGIFDLKYHSFVRPLSGAYMTLDDDPQLSLKKTNFINNKRAFEIGNCKYCYAPFIIGKICKNDRNDLDYLLQNSELDIYENYGDRLFSGIDWFLIDDITDTEEFNEEGTKSFELEDCIVCSKCGAISSADNLNANKCECGTEFEKHIYKVISISKNDNSLFRNNMFKCPCCGHSSGSGIVRDLNLGKDEGTSIIAQTLFEAIDEGESKANKENKISLKINKKKNNNNEGNSKVKQFLSFSDSRQQASFAAAFLDSNYNRILRKRLIWNVIEDNDYREISVDEMVAFLTSIIKEKKVFSNELSNEKNAWISVLIDLLKLDGVKDSEELGLYYYDIDLKELMEQIDEEDVNEEFGRYNINKDELETLIQVVLRKFRTVPAINYVKSALSYAERTEAFEYRRFDNYIMFKSSKSKKGIESFLPIRSESNKVVDYVKKVCDCDTESAKDVLDILFNNLAVAGGIMKKHEALDAYQIAADKYVIKNYRSSKYYKCSKCGRLTPYNIHNICIHDKCDGKLLEIDPDIDLYMDYFRNEYKTRKIERVVIKEHTAQLEKKKAREYQNDFKDKKINILSCSTTFELGIDIGNLETVFMRNVPPFPSNYVQRAGRAGRRKDSAAYVITYCSIKSHDYTYFNEPEKMISGVITPPKFNIVNKKIIIRHLMAICLGFFFRSYPDYFKSIDGIVFENGLEVFKKYIGSHPAPIKDYIDKKVLPGEKYEEYHDFKWFDAINGNDEKLSSFVEDVRSLADEFNGAKQRALVSENYSDADYYKRQINNLHKLRMIDSLSKYCVIPKYGFPVEVVDLKIYKSGVPAMDSSYNLSRDLKIAISEYAPASEVIVDGKKYVSQYITLPKTGEFQRHYYCTCKNCKKVNVFLSNNDDKECKYCGSVLDNNTNYYIEPIYGFKTGEINESTRLKPKRSYAGKVAYIGGGIKDETSLKIGNVMEVETSSDDELLVINSSDFVMCKKCGYCEKKSIYTEVYKSKKKHRNFRQFECDNKELEKIKIGHSFKTDVAIFTIPILSYSSSENISKALSFMYAFLEGISVALGIERRDIHGIIENNIDKGCYDLILYDDVPGGAGHVKRLINKNAIKKALLSAFNKVSQLCCDEETSCYNCLRNYYNQSYHSMLKRKYAKEIIKTILDNGSW